MKLGRSPALALVLFGFTSTHPKAPAPTAVTSDPCRVELAIDADGRATRLDLGRCEDGASEQGVILVARDHRLPDSYFRELARRGI